MNISQILKQEIRRFKTPSSILDVQVLLALVLKKSKEFILSHPEFKLTKNQTEKYQRLNIRRANGEPVAYLVGQKEFYGLNFMVNKNVLIPRPETELIIDEVIQLVTSRQSPTIIDVGTGSGCIAITLKKLLPKAEIIAIDKSKSALSVAKINATTHKTKIKFVHNDLLNKITKIKPAIIVANLPYVTNQEIKTSPDLKFEPHVALAGGKTGLDLYEKLFSQIIKLKISPQVIICEIGQPHWRQAIKLAQKYFPGSNIEIKPDLAGKNRVLFIHIISMH